MRRAYGPFDCATCGAVQDIDKMEGFYAKDVLAAGLGTGPFAPVVWLCVDCAMVVRESDGYSAR